MTGEKPGTLTGVAAGQRLGHFNRSSWKLKYVSLGSGLRLVSNDVRLAGPRLNPRPTVPTRGGYAFGACILYLDEAEHQKYM